MQDEIDLVDLGIKVVGFFRKIFWQLVIAAALGAGLGFGFFSLVPKQYESKMLVQSELFTSSIGASLVADLNQLAKEDNSDTLGARLNLNPLAAREIISLSLKSPIERADLLKESEKSTFIISLRLSSLENLTKIQTGLQKYLNNNRYSLHVERTKREYYQSVVSKFDVQINQLELLRTQYLTGKVLPANNESVYLFDPSNINEKLLEFEVRKLKYQDSLKLLGNVKIISGFTRFEKPVFPKLRQSVLVGAAVGVIVVLAIALLRRLNKALKSDSPAA